MYCFISIKYTINKVWVRRKHGNNNFLLALNTKLVNSLTKIICQNIFVTNLIPQKQTV